MRAYIRIFLCAILIYAISVASSYNVSRKLDIENIILSSTDFTFSDINNELNFYSVSDKTIDSAFQNINKNDIKILVQIIKDERQQWGPINYKLINMANSLFNTNSTWLSRINNSAKFAVYYTSIMLLKKFDDKGIEALSDLNFHDQIASARAAILDILQNGTTSEESRQTFRKRLLSEIDKSENFISIFHRKYCGNYSKKCIVPSLEQWYIDGEPTPKEMQKRKLEFRRYRNSDEGQNFEHSRDFIPVFPDLKNRLCNNTEANRLRGFYYRQDWESECFQNGAYINKVQRAVQSDITH